MKIFTYKNYPAINLNKVERFYVMTVGQPCVIFQFTTNETRWMTETNEEAFNVYNAIIDALSDEDHKHII